MVNLINDNRLVGSSLFFSSKGVIGTIVKLAGFFDFKRGFKMEKWSHVGTIVMQENGRLGVLEALNPVVVINDLEKRVKSCKDKMVLCRLDNKSYCKLTANMDVFNSNVLQSVGKKYNTFGAIASGIDIFPDNSWLSKQFSKFKKTMHCSYLDSLLKQNCEIIPEEQNISEVTPSDVYMCDIFDEKYDLN